jgi:hypothetical protein
LTAFLGVCRNVVTAFLRVCRNVVTAFLRVCRNALTAFLCRDIPRDGHRLHETTGKHAPIAGLPERLNGVP